LLQPVDDDEEEARSPSYPAAPDAHRIIGHDVANDMRIILLAVALPMTDDSVPFLILLQPDNNDEAEAWLPSSSTTPDTPHTPFGHHCRPPFLILLQPRQRG
jgi:hypothetical protein